MRIVGGIHRSRKLETPKNDAVRPTSDKVRQALFNMLNSRGLVQDAVVLDAFCGTGALGLEALSQGAKEAVFIDKARSSLDLCRANISNLGVGEDTYVLCQDSAKLKEKPDNFLQADLVFLDPPYRKGLVEEAVNSLITGGWLADDCALVIETASDEELNLPNIEILQEKTYGEPKITLAKLHSGEIK